MNPEKYIGTQITKDVIGRKKMIDDAYSDAISAYRKGEYSTVFDMISERRCALIVATAAYDGATASGLAAKLGKSVATARRILNEFISLRGGNIDKTSRPFVYTAK